MGRCCVFVYDHWLHSWPGFQPQTIVICDAFYKLLDWKEVGGSPILEKTTLVDLDTGSPIVWLTCKHRHTIPNPERGIYKVSLAGDKIGPLTVEWVYKDDAERAQYEEWRRQIRERRAKQDAIDNVPPCGPD